MKHVLLAILSLVSSLAFARRDEAVTFTHEGLRVSARISFPDGPGPFRAIVVVPGSGANDKDGTLPMSGGNANCLYPGLVGQTLRPYRGLSNALADSGYAVLTYDKVEYSNPSGVGAITLRKLWFPAQSGIEYLRTRSDIRGNDLILLGHSEGSTLIPRMALGDAGIKAMISLAGPRRSVYDTILAYQLVEIARKCGGDISAAQAQGEQLIEYFTLIRSGNWNNGTPPFAGVSAAVWSDYIKMADSVVLNYNAFPRPKLFIGLGDDLNVPVGSELAAFRREVTGNTDFYEIAGLNHYLSTATDPAVSKPLTDTILAWLRKEVPAVGVNAVKQNTESTFRVVREGPGIRLISSGESLQQVTIRDSNGRRVYQSKLSGTTARVQPGHLTSGIYSVEVQSVTSRELLRVAF